MAKKKSRKRTKTQADAAAAPATDPAEVAEVAEPATEQPKKRSKKLVVGKLAIERDPRVYRTIISRTLPQYKRLAGIDLATNCGIAFCDIIPGHPVKAARIIAGQWDLKVGDYDTGPLRHIRLKEFLSILQPDLVLFEDVKYAGQQPPPGTPYAAIIARAARPIEFIGGLKTTLTTWCEERGIPCGGVGITAVKRFLTGKGNVDKESMIRAANAKLHLDLELEDWQSSGVDNIADAAAICAMAVDAYSQGLDGDSVWKGLPDEALPTIAMEAKNGEDAPTAD